jgi:hypothetical protein
MRFDHGARLRSRASRARAHEQHSSECGDDHNLLRELAAVAEYIARLKREIGALRVNELCRERIPTVHQELGTVVRATAPSRRPRRASGGPG